MPTTTPYDAALHALRRASLVAAGTTSTVVGMATANVDTAAWTFLTNHSHVLLCIAQDPQIRIAEIARLVGIGERAAHRIVHDLIESGYVVSTKVGRRNSYEVHLDRPLRHPLEAHHRLADVFGPLTAR
jgi:hypothetical protein